MTQHASRAPRHETGRRVLHVAVALEGGCHLVGNVIHEWVCAVSVLIGDAVVKALEGGGFARISQRGSHVELRHSDGRTVIVPLRRRAHRASLIWRHRRARPQPSDSSTVPVTAHVECAGRPGRCSRKGASTRSCWARDPTCAEQSRASPLANMRSDTPRFWPPTRRAPMRVRLVGYSRRRRMPAPSNTLAKPSGVLRIFAHDLEQTPLATCWRSGELAGHRKVVGGERGWPRRSESNILLIS